MIGDLGGGVVKLGLLILQGECMYDVHVITLFMGPIEIFGIPAPHPHSLPMKSVS